jgi:hypothetical protein
VDSRLGSAESRIAVAAAFLCLSRVQRSVVRRLAWFKVLMSWFAAGAGMTYAHGNGALNPYPELGAREIHALAAS